MNDYIKFDSKDGVYSIEQQKVGEQYLITIRKRGRIVYDIKEFRPETYGELYRFLESFIAMMEGK